MNISDLDYNLPERLIAQHPSEPRDAARMLVLDRVSGSIREDLYRNIATYLRKGDCMALNDTRVIRARLRARKATGGRAEVFLLKETGPGEWIALVRPSAKIRPGTPLLLASGDRIIVEEPLENGQRRVRFERPDVLAILEASGEIPLPPYIHRERQDATDSVGYQTVYAAAPGAVAAPTAGLHFTPQVFQSLDDAGVSRAFLTLHVGYGTFKPIATEAIEDHRIEPEEFCLPEEAANLLDRTREHGGRVVAVGTTCTRVLETQYANGRYRPGAGATGTYIYPPYTFQGVDILQTNFHLPKSSLLALVYAFAGQELAQRAYTYAVEHEFRFYSYGDVMLIL